MRKRLNRVRRVICITMILCVIFSLSACQQEDTSFYVKSSGAIGESIVSDVIDVRLENECIDIGDSKSINITVGFGGAKKSHISESEQTWISIESEGCNIEGQQNSYQKYYTDFSTNDVYRPIKKERLWGWTYPELFPNYFEEIEVIFPEGECSGEVIFSFNDTLSNGAVITVSVSVYYAKTDTIIVFSAEADYDAERKLETLMSTE